MKRLALSVLLMATLGLAACGNTGDSSTVSTQTRNTTEQTTVSIKDSNGDRVEVQRNPQKVVVFDNGSLDTLDALGVGDRVIGAATKNLPSYLDKYKDVESAGGIKEPDLIIISGRQSDYKEELAKIAPTLYLAVNTKEPWESVQQNVNVLAEIFGKEDKAKEELATLTKEIEKTKEKACKLEQTALVTLVNEGQLSAYGSGSRFGLVHDVFGFKQADDQIEASTHGQSVSYEYILEKNPGILFVVDRTKAIGGDDSKDNVSANELVAQTDAGKNDQVISLQPDVWYLSGGGLESMKLMVEDVNQAFN